MRHMVAAFLLGRSQYQPQPNAQKTKKEIHPLSVNALSKIALPIIVQEKEIYSDSFTQFTEALFQDFDFELATELADKMADEAASDILLRPHATEIRRQALLYIFEVQARINKKGSDLAAFCEANDIHNIDAAMNEVETNMKQLGLLVERTKDGELSIHGNQFDVKGKILSQTKELFVRSEQLKQAYEKHSAQLEETIREQKQRDAAAAADEKKKKT